LLEGRITLRDAGAKTQLAAALVPRGDQTGGRIAHRHRHPDRALGRVRDRHWVVEKHSNWATSDPNAL
jgi:hypothetical protein